MEVRKVKKHMKALRNGKTKKLIKPVSLHVAIACVLFIRKKGNEIIQLKVLVMLLLH